MEFANDYRDFGLIVDPSNPNSKGEVYAICPQCDHLRKKPGEKKVGVNIKKGVWRCNHCDWTGGLTPIEWAKNKPKIDVSDINSLTDKQIAYFKGRGISHRTLLAREVKSKMASIKQKSTGEFKNRLCSVFTFREKGWVMMHKYRDGAKNFKIEKGSKLIPWGIDWIINEDECIITEGEIDTLSYHEVGLINVVSVPNGTAVSIKEQNYYKETGKVDSQSHLSLSYFDETYQYFENKRVIYIATDADAAGIKLRNEIGRRFGYEKCRYINYKEYTYEKNGKTIECKDANDVLVNCGPDILKTTLKLSDTFPIDDVITIEDAWMDIEEQWEHGLRKGKPTGYIALDAHFTWRFGHLILMNGYGNMGKSMMVFNLCVLSAILYDWKWGAYLPENYPISDAYITLMEIYLNNTLDKDKRNRATKEDMLKAKVFIKSHFELVNNEEGYTPEELMSVAKRMIMQRGIMGFITDPWNSLIHKRKPGQTLDEYLEYVLSAEQRFAINNSIINLIVVHPPTPQGDQKKKPKAPGYFEITGGGIWSKKAYDILCTHIQDIDADEWITELHVQKTKNHKLVGIPTKANPVLLRYIGRSNRFIQHNDYDPFEQINKKDEVQEDTDWEVF